ncbi:DUF1641 domain-containing protein [Halobellus limi]|uniref:DUF1641 domain-containing protein n=1 Tax=Halobellus limi TaxID=699433 RepID=A0A1H6BFW6_9EURY|nr:DUF1641 domain-containing protein [Halobellus limi]QCC49004.1 DUF1641 domain-containing protein [Halobellus limi]SEG59225.1 Uncharacterized conserved protein YjgD, DUF1641 family [Halobellus limi]
MSATDEDGTGVDAESIPTEVREAIADNPEAVVALLEQSGQLSTLLDALALVEDGLDDEMVESLTADATTLGLAATELADQRAVELSGAVGQHGDDLAEAVERLAMLQRSGTLDRVAEVADAVALLTDATDDEMVETVAATGTSLGELADTTADEEVRRGLVRILEGVSAASAEEAEPVGPVGLLGALRDPEVKAGMGYLLAVVRGIGTVAPDGDGPNDG